MTACHDQCSGSFFSLSLFLLSSSLPLLQVVQKPLLFKSEGMYFGNSSLIVVLIICYFFFKEDGKFLLF